MEGISRVKKTDEEGKAKWEESNRPYKEKSNAELLEIFCENMFLDMYYGIGGGDGFELTKAMYFLSKRGFDEPLEHLRAMYHNFSNAVWEIRILSGQWYPTDYDPELARKKCGANEEDPEEFFKSLEQANEHNNTHNENEGDSEK